MDQHRHHQWVKPICRVFQIAPSAYQRDAAQCKNPLLLSRRAQRDSDLVLKIEDVWQANWSR